MFRRLGAALPVSASFTDDPSSNGHCWLADKHNMCWSSRNPPPPPPRPPPTTIGSYRGNTCLLCPWSMINVRLEYDTEIPQVAALVTIVLSRRPNKDKLKQTRDRFERSDHPLSGIRSYIRCYPWQYDIVLMELIVHGLIVDECRPGLCAHCTRQNAVPTYFSVTGPRLSVHPPLNSGQSKYYLSQY